MISIMLSIAFVWFFLTLIYDQSKKDMDTTYTKQVTQISNVTNTTNQLIVNLDQKINDISNRQIILYQTLNHIINDQPISKEFNESLKFLNGQITKK